MRRFAGAALLVLAGLAGAGARADGTAALVLPPACATDCVAPWGQVLGVASGQVAAYSNCNARCFVPMPNREHGTYTGIRWQCVEFARRWLLENRGVVYGDIDVAADLWLRVDTVERVVDGMALPLQAHLNGDGEPPQVGDLLVYGREYLRTGHIAVVTAVDPDAGTLAVAEQNFRNEPWPADYARRIDFVRRGERYWVLDPHLIGWKRVSAP